MGAGMYLRSKDIFIIKINEKLFRILLLPFAGCLPLERFRCAPLIFLRCAAKYHPLTAAGG